MKSFIALLIVLVLAVSTQAYDKRRLNIVGGTNATNHQFPFMASVSVGNSGCGGFILDSTHIGTAAHCFLPTLATTPVASISVQVGTNDISNASAGQTLNATSFNIHPLFNGTTLLYDAAIITLATPITIDGSSTRVIAAAATQLTANGSATFVAGWGLTSTNGSGSNDLLFVSLPFVVLTTCNNTYGGLQSGIQICAGGVAGQDSCQGDSGGPLFTTTNIADPIDAKVIGIVSFGGQACAVAGEPGVYSDVPGFANSFFQGIISGSASAAATVAASSGAVAASSGAVAASSSKAVAASSSKAVAASSSKAVAASSSGAVAASSSGAVAASSSGAALPSKTSSKSQSKTASVSNPNVAASSVAVAASSGAVAASSVVHASATVAASKGAKSKSIVGAAAIACRQNCQSAFVSCKKTTRRLRTCRRSKKQCVAGCGTVNLFH